MEEKPDNGKRRQKVLLSFLNFGSLLMFISDFFKKNTNTHVGSWKNMGSGCFFWGMAWQDVQTAKKKNKISN